MKDAINDQMKQYAVYSDEIDKIQEHINDNILSDDQFDSIVPFTQNRIPKVFMTYILTSMRTMTYQKMLEFLL